MPFCTCRAVVARRLISLPLTHRTCLNNVMTQYTSLHAQQDAPIALCPRIANILPRGVAC